ncbi:MAG: MoxR family ATPase [Eubacteriales bacterium]|nr:MoxR family ATPase [Eubacteriales bacterium]
MVNQEKAKLILENVKKVIVGKEDVSKLVMTAILAGGHVLLEDVPGTGKTVMARTFAKSIDSEFSRIQFTPDLLPSDVTGIHFYNQKESEFVLRKGPVFANVLLADEINRATPRTQSALLECMEEHQVTIDGETLALKEPFVVIATENPVETTGTYPLPEAQLDRFLMKVSVGYPEKSEEITMIERFLDESPLSAIEPVCTGEEIAAMQKEVKSVYIHPSLMEYIVNLVHSTRTQNGVMAGVSPRGTLKMINAVRAYAYIEGRTYVVPEDISTLAVPVWAHRIVLELGLTRGDNRERIIENVISEVEVPTEDWNK